MIDQWNNGYGKPVTLEDIERSFELIKNQAHPQLSRRIVSHEIYKRAEKAIAKGAGFREIELILAGASEEMAAQLVSDDKPS